MTQRNALPRGCGVSGKGGGEQSHRRTDILKYDRFSSRPMTSVWVSVSKNGKNWGISKYSDYFLSCR